MERKTGTMISPLPLLLISLSMMIILLFFCFSYLTGSYNYTIASLIAVSFINASALLGFTRIKKPYKKAFRLK
ncbi:hypothetical protein SAMN05216353_11438 [Halobacillus alkaliphilus]|uniref:Uncharacterized protein n=1 Tax=Halobacillus alkaliphilus TaxID=396056 RepID=A0A1I2MNS3_9BACI|nr:hypothetical protein SAMN05216353_11438 [Halobacillus alkaliphilus]